MHSSTTSQPPVDLQAPLASFSQCHTGITSQLEALAGLPALVEAAQRARAVAAGTVNLFKDAVFEHHAQEESELFTAVLRSAAAGEERDRIMAMVSRLTSEHRALEALWKTLEPQVESAAHGRASEIDAGLAHQLVHGYLRHARFEEQEFLPLAATILERDGNHMAALGLSLHLRRTPQPVGYI